MKRKKPPKDFSKMLRQPGIYLGIGLSLFTAYPIDLIAQAQELSTPTKQLKQEEKQVFYVNPKTGDDLRGKGTSTSPFKTISQALLLAKANTTIILAPGEYSEETGEVFPLVINQDITIKGNPVSKGHNVIIKGNGSFISPTSAAQNVTIAVVKSGGEITGVTITNPHQRGYGLWLESAKIKVTNNSLRNNGNSGISVNGNTVILISNNYFFNNGGNGLIIYGNSQPEVRDNVFEKTGFGISALENSVSFVANNQLIGNKVGIILEGKAQAILRNNSIENSIENGLITLGEAQADLGTQAEPGENNFSGNRGLDIQNITTNQIIYAFGNQLSGSYQGKIDFGAKILPLKVSPPVPSPDRSLEVNESEGGIAIPVPPPINSVNQTNNYRVLVEVNNPQEEIEVRRLYPEAFSVVFEGKSALQIGVFTTRENAENALEKLNPAGVDGKIVEF
jgi:parallel beta-helix repeat protein